MKKSLSALAVSLLAGLSSLAAAQSHEHAGHAAATSATAAAALSEGEVRKIDKDAKKLTLRHGPIPNLDMPGMTMVFLVQDPTMLDRVKAGDKVRFAAETIAGAITVTRIEAIN